MTTSALKVAAIGVGAMGRNHARIYSELPYVKLVGVADTNPDLANGVALKTNTKAYTDYRQMLDEQQPDSISIAVPTVDHLQVALEVIGRGIHLLIEKPIAFSVEEGVEIINAARNAGVKLMIGHVERFNPAVLALKAKLLEGALGRVFQIDARRQGPFPARIRDVGVVIDLAVHDIDIIRYVTNTEIVRVYAETERRIHSTREDLLTSLIRLNDGTIGTLMTNWLTPTKIRELYVTGECGMYRVDYITQDLYFYENATTTGSQWDALQALRGVSEGMMTRYVINKREPLLAEIESFLTAIREDKPIPVKGEDGLRALEVALALVQSGVENRAIDCTPVTLKV